MTPLLNGISNVAGGIKKAVGGAVDNIASYGIGKYGAGNIDLFNRPQHVNEDGSVSTVLSRSYAIDGGKALLAPSVAKDGTILSRDEAFDYAKKTGENLGIFPSQKKADIYAQRLHIQQERLYPSTGGGSIWQ